jgi:hypothetical protein
MKWIFKNGKTGEVKTITDSSQFLNILTYLLFYDKFKEWSHEVVWE